MGLVVLGLSSVGFRGDHRRIAFIALAGADDELTPVKQAKAQARGFCMKAEDQGQLTSPQFRVPKDHINLRILETMISDIPPFIGPSNQKVRSLCICGRVGPLVKWGCEPEAGNHRQRPNEVPRWPQLLGTRH